MKNGTAVRNRNKLVRSGQIRSGQDQTALFEVHRIFLQTQDASG